ncbi:MAG TPA: hypothetical protein VN970_10395, partial [Thermoanaerobaculia bacterium]|nr:hypothetical protein [Thermoanaerobaculia bacterium]
MLLEKWATAQTARRQSEAAATLQMARTIAGALAAAHGERMAADTVAQLDRMAQADPAWPPRLAAGLLAYRQGLELEHAGRFAEALSRFRRARGGLDAVSSPFARWATFQIAFCLYQHLNYPEARRELARLLKAPSPERYSALRGRALTLAGLIHAIEGHHTEAINAYET